MVTAAAVAAVVAAAAFFNAGFAATHNNINISAANKSFILLYLEAVNQLPDLAQGLLLDLAAPHLGEQHSHGLRRSMIKSSQHQQNNTLIIEIEKTHAF